MIVTSEQQRRYTAFWNHEPVDRACMYLSAWDGAEPFPVPASLDEQWADLDRRERETVYNVAHTLYFAEAFPLAFPNYGPGALTACIGGTYAFAPETVWFENQPFFVEDWENHPAPKYNPDAPLAKLMEALKARLLRHRDAFVTSITDVGGTYDIIAALRGTENLLFDMIDEPESVHAFHDEIAPLWKAYFRKEAQELIRAQGCMTSWMPIWSETPYYPLQCDYSAMIGPEMFREFVLPDLDAQTKYMDRSVYHLDGPGELQHLDMLLSLPGVNAIQWTSGAGNAPVTDPCWFPLYKRIQDAGKGLVLLNAETRGAQKLFENIHQQGVFFHAAVENEEEAEELIKMAVKLNH